MTRHPGRTPLPARSGTPSWASVGFGQGPVTKQPSSCSEGGKGLRARVRRRASPTKESFAREVATWDLPNVLHRWRWLERFGSN